MSCTRGCRGGCSAAGGREGATDGKPARSRSPPAGAAAHAALPVVRAGGLVDMAEDESEKLSRELHRGLCGTKTARGPASRGSRAELG